MRGDRDDKVELVLVSAIHAFCAVRGNHAKRGSLGCGMSLIRREDGNMRCSVHGVHRPWRVPSGGAANLGVSAADVASASGE